MSVDLGLCQVSVMLRFSVLLTECIGFGYLTCCVFASKWIEWKVTLAKLVGWIDASDELRRRFNSTTKHSGKIRIPSSTFYITAFLIN